MNLLSENELKEWLEKLNRGINSEWTIAKTKITKQYKFDDFESAFRFMTRVADEAEKLDHHPDWCNSYNRVSIDLTTHSAGGLTELDFRLAAKIETISSSLPRRRESI